MVAAASLLGACAGSRPTLGAAAPRDTTTSTAAAASTTSGASTTTTAPVVLGPSNLLGYIATPKGTPAVYAQPSTTATTIAINAKTEAGAPTTFAVVGDASPTATLPHPGWFEVELPTRPNGGTGWVQTASVSLTKTPLQVFVDLGARTLRVENAGVQVFRTTVAVGTPDNPTPTGATYVTELIQNTDPKGAYGPYAFGLALHSDTLTEFGGGDGQVGIHGTDQPKLIGQRVSHGCVRLTNADIQKLVGLQLPLGVPVFIT